MNKWIDQESPKALTPEQAGQLAYMKLQFAPSLAVMNDSRCVASSAGMFAALAGRMSEYQRSLSQCTPEAMSNRFVTYKSQFEPAQWDKFMEYFNQAQEKAEQIKPRTMIVNAFGDDAKSVSSIAERCAKEVKKMPLGLDDEMRDYLVDIVKHRVEEWLNKRVENEEAVIYPLICKFSQSKMYNVLGNALGVEHKDKITDGRIKAVRVKVGQVLADILQEHGQLIEPEQQQMFR